MPILTPHLFRRGAIFYWRKRLPAPLDTLTGKSHYCRTLGTSDRRFATRLSHALSIAVDDLANRLSAMPTNALSRELVDEAIKETVSECFKSIKDGTFKPGIDSGARYGMPSWLITIRAMLEASLAQRDANIVADSLDHTLAKFKSPLDRQDDQYAAIAQAIIYRLVKMTPLLAPEGIGDPTSEQIESVLLQTFGASNRANTAAPDADSLRQSNTCLSEVAEKFISSRAALPNTRKDTIKDYERSLSVFIQLIGDIPLSRIDKSVAKRFKEALTELPARNGRDCYLTKPDHKLSRGRKIGFPLPVKDQIELCKDISEALSAGRSTYALSDGRVLNKAQMEAATEMLSPATINKYLMFFTTLWKSDYVPEHLQERSPFSRLIFAKKFITQTNRGKARRSSFANEELEALFATPAWAGCLDPWHRSTAGKFLIWDARYWVPLIALYSGMRREEICQLGPDNIEIVDEIWLFRLAPSKTMRLKSDAAAREVPIHPELLRLGFKKHVQAARSARHKRLFPELVASAAHDALGDSVGKWFYRYRNDLGIYSPGKDLHSLRTTFISHLRRKGVDAEMVANLVGHNFNTVAARHYATGFSLKDKANAISIFNIEIPSLKASQGLTIIDLNSKSYPTD